MRRAILCLVGLGCLAWGVGCGSSEGPPVAAVNAPPATTAAGTGADAATPPTAPDATLNGGGPRTPAVELKPVVVIRTDRGDITVELDAEQAPHTVDNFLQYVARDFYRNTIFHFVEAGFMISAGGYQADGTAPVTRAYVTNEAHNGLKNLRGTIAMARDPEFKHSAAAQFFINLADNPGLDHQSDESDEQYGYCVFGRVTQGLDVVEAIGSTPVVDDAVFQKRPAQPVTITEIVRLK